MWYSLWYFKMNYKLGITVGKIKGIIILDWLNNW